MKLSWKMMIILVGLFIALGYFLFSISRPALYIEALVDEGKKGELGQIQGIKASLKRNYNGKIEYRQWSPNQYKDLETVLIQPVKSPHTRLVLLVGSDGIQAIERGGGKGRTKDTKIAHIAHQVFNDHGKLWGHVDALVLPQHTITEEIREQARKMNTTLVETVGVAHNVTHQEIKAEYKKYQNDLPCEGALLVVILGGDTELPDKSWKLYSEAAAVSLANYIVQIVKHDPATPSVIILNGPRTGQRNPKTNEKRTDVHINSKIDPVTVAFKEVLISSLGEKKVTLFDFQSGQPSLYKAVLGALMIKGGKIYVPGESTSMISECADNFSPETIIVYEHEAMGEGHHKHVELEAAMGRIQLLNEEFKIVKGVKIPEQIRSSGKDHPADVVGKALLRLMVVKN